jgi:LacI family transcriptional regulator
MGLGALQAIQEAGLQPGRDVGVLIFDGLPWAQLLRPPISVITQPTYEIGLMAGEMLLSRLRDPDRPVQRRSLRGELVIRPSSLRSGHHPKAV